MPIYVKKRIPIHAVQFRADKLRPSWKELVEFTGGLVKNHEPEDDGDWAEYYVFDYLHNTWVSFKPGDWILKGIKGEFYPCEEAVFEETYEEIATPF